MGDVAGQKAKGAALSGVHSARSHLAACAHSSAALTCWPERLRHLTHVSLSRVLSRASEALCFPCEELISKESSEAQPSPNAQVRAADSNSPASIWAAASREHARGRSGFRGLSRQRTRGGLLISGGGVGAPSIARERQGVEEEGSGEGGVAASPLSHPTVGEM